MKKSACLLLFAFAVGSFTLSSCGGDPPAETTGTTFTEDMVTGADGGLDSLELNEDQPDTTNTNTSEADTITTVL